MKKAGPSEKQFLASLGSPFDDFYDSLNPNDTLELEQRR